MRILNIIERLFGAPREWHWYEPNNPVIGVDGRELSGPIMRRKINGLWQYRAATDQEHKEECERQVFSF